MKYIVAVHTEVDPLGLRAIFQENVVVVQISDGRYVYVPKQDIDSDAQLVSRRLLK